MTFGAVQDELCVEWFGQVVERHYRRACNLLKEDGMIRNTERRIDERTVLEFV
jgi:hypothetical protein